MKRIERYGKHQVINHDTKEYFFYDGRKPENCICCYTEKAKEIDTTSEAAIMNTLCPKHLYEYIY